MPDPRFKEAVILVCETKITGSFGLIVNQNIPDKKFKDIFEYTDLEAFSMHIGGPVDNERGFMLHTTDMKWKETLEITPDIGITNIQEVLNKAEMVELPSSILVIMGYTSWGEEQLERELKDGIWIPVCVDAKKLIFEIDAKEKWNFAIKASGLNKNTISPYAGSA